MNVLGSNLKFGTSGIRGLASEFTSKSLEMICSAYKEMLIKRNYWTKISNKIVICHDLRESSPLILEKLVSSLSSLNFEVLLGGHNPTPAMANFLINENLSGIMISGSHIPADRNGLKFYGPWGEFSKFDEQELISHLKNRTESHLSESQLLPAKILDISHDISSQFKNRYIHFLDSLATNKEPRFFSNFKISIYEHSSCCSKLLGEILTTFGASVHYFGKTNFFYPLDTENIENVPGLSEEILSFNPTLIVSTDADGDRPLILDETGKQIEGDIIGIITAKFLNPKKICTTIHCNESIKLNFNNSEISYTKIGSPYIVEEMKHQEKQHNFVVGFEPNGGFLVGKNLMGLTPLCTRDSFLPILVCLMAFHKSQQKNFSSFTKKYQISLKKSYVLSPFESINWENLKKRTLDTISKKNHWIDKISTINELDGLRIVGKNKNIFHIRPSGNAPELRIYLESRSNDLCNFDHQEILQFIKSLIPK